MSGSFGGAGVGGMLFGGGGGAAGGPSGSTAPSSASFNATPGAVKGPSGGKNSMQQNLHSPHSGLRQTMTAGDPMSRSMSQYGKGHSYNSGLGGIRGGMGQMRRIRGGLGPGKTGEAGGSSDYSMKTMDTE